MEPAPARFAAPAARPLWLFASLWSLRQYPTRQREWSWHKKFATIRAAGFEGILSPPAPEVSQRGELRYLAITSIRESGQVLPVLRAARQLGALAIGIQLGEPQMAPAAALKLCLRIRAVAMDLALPFAIETHRGTFTETPETTQWLGRAYRRNCRELLPLCLDHSHFALVRHLTPETTWSCLGAAVSVLRAARQFHLRPFNGHHAQLPVLTPGGRRTVEYLAWRRMYAKPLLHYLCSQPASWPVLAVPEIGHAAPAYGLSCFGDTWQDVLIVTRDLRRIWAEAPKVS